MKKIITAICMIMLIATCFSITSCNLPASETSPTPTHSGFEIESDNSVRPDEILSFIGAKTVDGETFVAYKISGELTDAFCQMTVYVYTDLHDNIGKLRTYCFFNSELAKRSYLVTRGAMSGIADFAWQNSFYVDASEEKDCSERIQEVTDGTLTLYE